MRKTGPGTVVDPVPPVGFVSGRPKDRIMISGQGNPSLHTAAIELTRVFTVHRAHCRKEGCSSLRCRQALAVGMEKTAVL